MSRHPRCHKLYSQGVILKVCDSTSDRRGAGLQFPEVIVLLEYEIWEDLVVANLLTDAIAQNPKPAGTVKTVGR